MELVTAVFLFAHTHLHIYVCLLLFSCCWDGLLPGASGITFSSSTRLSIGLLGEGVGTRTRACKVVEKAVRKKEKQKVNAAIVDSAAQNFQGKVVPWQI